MQNSHMQSNHMQEIHQITTSVIIIAKKETNKLKK